jgi:hypothetical protein
MLQTENVLAIVLAIFMEYQYLKDIYSIVIQFCHMYLVKYIGGCRLLKTSMYSVL